MSSTIKSDTIIKISIFNIGITSIHNLFYKSIIIYYNYKTDKVGPYDKSNEIIGNRKYVLIIFQRFIVIAIKKTNMLQVKIGVTNLK